MKEEAVKTYTHFLEYIDQGKIRNVPAPRIAKDYWGLPENATLRDVILVIRYTHTKRTHTKHTH
jgi:ubiquinol oxidase